MKWHRRRVHNNDCKQTQRSMEGVDNNAFAATMICDGAQRCRRGVGMHAARQRAGRIGTTHAITGVMPPTSRYHGEMQSRGAHLGCP